MENCQIGIMLLNQVFKCQQNKNVLIFLLSVCNETGISGQSQGRSGFWFCLGSRSKQPPPASNPVLLPHSKIWTILAWLISAKAAVEIKYSGQESYKTCSVFSRSKTNIQIKEFWRQRTNLGKSILGTHTKLSTLNIYFLTRMIHKSKSSAII